VREDQVEVRESWRGRKIWGGMEGRNVESKGNERAKEELLRLRLTATSWRSKDREFGETEGIKKKGDARVSPAMEKSLEWRLWPQAPFGPHEVRRMS
jgi:hypothetical protein